jgi:hypothetical protein
LPLPTPVAGLVIRYRFLWRDEAANGQEEGRKDRPCAVLLAVVSEDGETVVTVLPITHAPPRDPTLAVELPQATKRRMGLDEQRSWIVLTDANRFAWPGPDLRPLPGGDISSVGIGLLPRSLYNEVRDRFIAAARRRRTGTVDRGS